MIFTSKRSRLVQVFAALLCVALVPSFASAHNLSVGATIEPNQPERIKIVAAFDDESPASFAKVFLRDASEMIIAETTTDAEGICAIPRPQAGSYSITVTDDSGHRRSVRIEVPPSSEEMNAIQPTRVNRLLMTAVGLVVIAGLSFLARLRIWTFSVKRTTNPNTPNTPQVRHFLIIPISNRPMRP